MSVAHDQPQIMAAVKACLRDPLMQAFIGSQLALHRMAAERRPAVPAPAPVRYAFDEQDPPPLTAAQADRAGQYVRDHHEELQALSPEAAWQKAESYARGR